MISVTVGGEEKSPLMNSLQIGMALGQQSTCMMKFFEKGAWIDGGWVGGGWRPAVGAPVEIYDHGALIYAGSVDDSEIEEIGPDVWSVTVHCIDHTAIPHRRLAAEYVYENTTPSAIATAICEGSLAGEGIGTDYITDPSPAVTIQSFATNWESVAEALSNLAKLSGQVWRVTPDKQLRLYQETAYPAPFNITSDPLDAKVKGLTIKNTREQYANRCIVKMPKSLVPGLVDTFDATGRTSTNGGFDDAAMALNGNRKSFDVSWPIYEVPSITINDVAQSVGIQGTDVATFYWSQGSQRLEMDDGASAPLATDVMVVTYTAIKGNVIAVQNNAAVSDRSSVEGGSGFHEIYRVVDDPTTVAAATEYATALVNRLSALSYVATYETTTKMQPLAAGLEIGQAQTIARSGFAADGTYLIRSLTISDMKTCADVELVYRVEAVKGPILGDSYDFFWALAGGGGNSGLLTVPTTGLGGGSPAITFGLAGALSTSPQYAWPCRLSLADSQTFTLASASATFVSPPVGADAQIDIEYSADGTTWASIFPAGAANTLVVTDGSSEGETTAFSGSVPALGDGYYLRPVPLQVGSTEPGTGVQIVLRGVIS